MSLLRHCQVRGCRFVLDRPRSGVRSEATGRSDRIQRSNPGRLPHGSLNGRYVVRVVLMFVSPYFRTILNYGSKGPTERRNRGRYGQTSNAEPFLCGKSGAYSAVYEQSMKSVSQKSDPGEVPTPPICRANAALSREVQLIA